MQVTFRKLTAKEKNKIVKYIEDWIMRYGITDGEQLHQSDNGLIYSPNLVSDIIDDIIKPKVQWEDND